MSLQAPYVPLCDATGGRMKDRSMERGWEYLVTDEIGRVLTWLMLWVQLMARPVRADIVTSRRIATAQGGGYDRCRHWHKEGPLPRKRVRSGLRYLLG